MVHCGASTRNKRFRVGGTHTLDSHLLGSFFAPRPRGGDKRRDACKAKLSSDCPFSVLASS